VKKRLQLKGVQIFGLVSHVGGDNRCWPWREQCHWRSPYSYRSAVDDSLLGALVVV